MGRRAQSVSITFVAKAYHCAVYLTLGDEMVIIIGMLVGYSVLMTVLAYYLDSQSRDWKDAYIKLCKEYDINSRMRFRG